MSAGSEKGFTSSWRRSLSGCLLLLGTFAILAANAASAPADLVFPTSRGSGAGQMTNPGSIAVDPSNGNLFVADRGNSRIDVFESDGTFSFAFGWGVADGSTAALQTCTTTCYRGLPGTGSGQFPPGAAMGNIAIDRDSASPTYRDLSVVTLDEQSGSVQRFHPDGSFVSAFTTGIGFGTIALGPSGDVYAAKGPNLLRRFSSAGALLAETTLLPTGLTNLNGLAVNGLGDVYVASAGNTGAIRKYGPSGTLLSTFEPSFNISAIATDDAGDLFVSDVFSPSSALQARGIAEFDPGGTELRVLYGDHPRRSISLAPYSDADGDIFSLTEDRGGGAEIAHIPLPSPGPLVLSFPGVTTATGVSSAKATLNAQVNPEGGPTTYHFEYVDEATYEADIAAAGPGHGFDHARTTPESEPIGSDFSLHATKALIGCPDPINEVSEGKCLTPQTIYHFRVVAANPGGTDSAEGQFETRQAPEVKDTWAADVGPDSAVLNAAVDPVGLPTTGYFEYIDDASFQETGFLDAIRAPSAPAQLDFGAAESATSRSVALNGLEPDVVYHYRLVAANPLNTVTGPERSFATFPVTALPKEDCVNQVSRNGASARLPDCRAYEMVSPVEKGNADIAVLGSTRSYPALHEQSSIAGSRFAYSSSTAFGDSLSAPYTSEYLADRDPTSGWSSRSLNPPRQSPSLISEIGPKLDVQYKAFSGDLGSGWLLHDAEPALDECAVPGYLNLYRRGLTGGYEALTTAKPASPQVPNGYYPELQGVSADGSHAIFTADAKLTANASKAGKAGGSGSEPVSQLYEHVAGEGCGTLRLVSVLPNGKASAADNSSAGRRNNAGTVETRENTVARAFSADGSRVVWSTTSETNGALYLRLNADAPETSIKDSEGNCVPDPDLACTILISSGLARFWTASSDDSRVIYSMSETQQLFEYDLSSQTSTLIAGAISEDAGGRGVVEASDDLSHLYFLSEEALGGEGQPGEPNLYLRRLTGQTKLIATLGGGETTGGIETSGFAVGAFIPMFRGTRSTPSGVHLAFVSTLPLTGYDNHDASDGRPNLELFLYDAEADHLACISCNPSGGRPQGRKFEAQGVVIRVSGQMAPVENQLYVPHALSEDGNRLFFESYEGLLPRDTNGKEDVYEWQRAAGQTDCEERGAELYVASAGGCLSLISSGESPQDSVLADASPSGDDVFIKTASSLLPQDPGLVDIYDARVGGGFPEPQAVSSCEGEACQGPLSAPDDPTPASAAFQGAGNVHEVSNKCHKGKVRRKGRCVSKKHHKRHHKTKGRQGK